MVSLAPENSGALFLPPPTLPLPRSPDRPGAPRRPPPAARGQAEAGKPRACAVGTEAGGEKRGAEGGRWSRVAAYRAACDAGTPRAPNVAPV